MHKVLGVGLLVSLFASGCVSGPALVGTPMAIRTPASPAEIEQELLRTRTEISRFYNWLGTSHQLLTRVRPYPKTWPKPRKIDPTTWKPIPKEEPTFPTVEELKEQLEELLKDQDFYDQWTQPGTPLR